MNSNGTAELPEGWEYRPLHEIAEVNPRRPDYDGRSDDEEVFFVPMAAVRETDGTVANAERARLGEVRNKSYRTFAPSDVLFAKITPCMENGKAAVVPAPARNSGLARPNSMSSGPATATPGYIWRYVRRKKRFRRRAEASMTGSVGQARVPAEFLEKF